MGSGGPHLEDLLLQEGGEAVVEGGRPAGLRTGRGNGLALGTQVREGGVFEPDTHSPGTGAWGRGGDEPVEIISGWGAGSHFHSGNR